MTTGNLLSSARIRRARTPGRRIASPWRNPLLSGARTRGGRTPGSRIASPWRNPRPSVRAPAGSRTDRESSMTTRASITQFELDPDRLAVIAECTNAYSSLYEPDAEWPHNILSRRTVVYGSGRIAKIGEEVTHAVDPDELELCRRLSSEVAALMAGTEVGMGTESCSQHEFSAFYIAGNVGEAVQDEIDADMILERFGDTIFPLAVVTTEALVEEADWWSAVLNDFDGEDDEVKEEKLASWRRMMDWFKGRAEFISTAFVCIGDMYELISLPEEEFPFGTEGTGSVLPRLALGLTRGGSLAGLFGYTVQSS